jgi:hypothetical protein
VGYIWKVRGSGSTKRTLATPSIPEPSSDEEGEKKGVRAPLDRYSGPLDSIDRCLFSASSAPLTTVYFNEFPQMMPLHLMRKRALSLRTRGAMNMTRRQLRIPSSIDMS